MTGTYFISNEHDARPKDYCFVSKGHVPMTKQSGGLRIVSRGLCKKPGETKEGRYNPM